METRTGSIGDCYEYDRNGRRLSGTDQGTIEYMVSLSRKWPDTYHQYVSDTCVVWAKSGRELAGCPFPEEPAKSERPTARRLNRSPTRRAL